MKIAVIGTGHMGASLARAWARKGHELILGVRNPVDGKLVALCKETGARAADVSSAGSVAEVVVLAIPYAAIEEVMAKLAGLSGKIVIDCTNGLAPGAILRFANTTSLAEENAKKLPHSRLVKAFNAQGAENIGDPIYNGLRATNFFLWRRPGC